MNQPFSIRPTQAGRALVVLAALGFTALVGLAALEPANEPRRVPAATPSHVAQSFERESGVHMIEPGVLAGESSQHFERSNEPAIDVDPANTYGG